MPATEPGPPPLVVDDLGSAAAPHLACRGDVLIETVAADLAKAAVPEVRVRPGCDPVLH